MPRTLEPNTEAAPRDWQSADDVLRAAADLLDFADQAADTPLRLRHLITSAGLHLARRQRHEALFRLLACIQLPMEQTDGDLLRLRNAAILHEVKRTSRIRRRLLFLLLGVLAYLLLISPTVFVALENPHRLANNMSELDWSEGLYWSVITSTTVGYGDIVPQTPYARMFALFNALLGVTLSGVVAGIILSLVTPRRL